MDQHILEKFSSLLWGEFDLRRLILSAVVVVVTIVLLIVMRIGYRKFNERIHLTEDLKRNHGFLTVYRIIKAFVVFMAVVAIMTVNRIHLPFVNLCVAVLAAVAVLMIKDSFQDFLAAFTILLDKYYSVGDAVEYDGRDGVVVSFTIRTTKIEFLDDRSVMSIANRHITKIKKLTHMVDIDLPLSYELESKRAYEVLARVCDEVRLLEGIEDCQFKGVHNFGESAAIYKIRFFCEPMNRPDIRRSVVRIIQKELEQEGIRIPYSQLDVHQKT